MHKVVAVYLQYNKTATKDFVELGMCKVDFGRKNC